MRKTYLEKLLEEGYNRHKEWNKVATRIDDYVSQLCDFKCCVLSHIKDYRVLNLEDVCSAPISCLKGKTKNNKLTAEEHKKLSNQNK